MLLSFAFFLFGVRIGGFLTEGVSYGTRFGPGSDWLAMEFSKCADVIWLTLPHGAL
jgi:hypothetical protein